MHQKCLEIQRQVFSDNHVDVALTEMNIGNVLSAQGDFKTALVHLQKALKIQEVALGPSHVSVADTKFNIAVLYRKQGKNIIQSRDLFLEAAAVYTTVYGANHSKTTTALNQAKLDSVTVAMSSCCAVS